MRFLHHRWFLLLGEVIVLYPLVGWTAMARLIPARWLRRFLGLLACLVLTALSGAAQQDSISVEPGAGRMNFRVGTKT